MPPDSLYWSTVDVEGSEDSVVSDTLPRHYVDPWDLENYAYIRQHLDSQETTSEVSSFGEPLDASSFYYTSGRSGCSSTRRRPPRKFADEEEAVVEARSPRLEKYVSSKGKRTPRRQQYDSLLESEYGTGRYAKIEEFSRRFPEHDDYYGAIDFGAESDEEEDIYGENPARGSSLLYVYQTGTHKQKIALPQPILTQDRRYSYSYGDIRPRRHPESSLYGQLEEYRKTESERTVPIYDDIRSTRRSRPKNFGLSTYGHLKIDYSCSWNNLDKFIYS